MWFFMYVCICAGFITSTISAVPVCSMYVLSYVYVWRVVAYNTQLAARDGRKAFMDERQKHTMLYNILYIIYYTILYYTLLYHTILYYTILYYTILYYTILYYTILHCREAFMDEQQKLMLRLLRERVGPERYVRPMFYTGVLLQVHQLYS